MLERVSYQFNLLPRAPRNKKSLAAVVREEVARRGKKWLICFKETKLPQSLVEIGGIDLRDWDILDSRGFINDFCEKIIQLYGPFEETLKQDNLEFALRELIKNAVLHGNKGKLNKKVFISFKKDENGLVIDVFDEGKGQLILLRSSTTFREFACWFRLGHGGQNIGIAAIQRYFGKENLTAAKICNQSGKRVGTRVSLFVPFKIN
jgi:hypothetical protein